MATKTKMMCEITRIDHHIELSFEGDDRVGKVRVEAEPLDIGEDYIPPMYDVRVWLNGKLIRSKLHNPELAGMSAGEALGIAMKEVEAYAKRTTEGGSDD